MSHIKLSRSSIGRIVRVHYQSLTELYVEDCMLYDSPSELLHCLSNLPSLANLSLISAFSEGTYSYSIREPQIPQRSVLLSKLMKLRFKSDLTIISCILPYLHFSSRAKVQLEVDSEAFGPVTASTPSRLNSIVQFLANHFEPWITDGVFFRAIRLRYRHVQEEGTSYLAIAADELINDSEDVQAITPTYIKCLNNAIPSPPLLEIALDKDLVLYDDFAQLFPLILNSVPALMRVPMFEVHMPFSLRSVIKKSVIRLLTSTSFEVIQVTYDSWLPLSEAIKAHKNDDGQLALPSLHELRVGGAHLSKASEHVERQIYPPKTIRYAIRILISCSLLRCVKIDSRDEHYADGFLRKLGKIVDVERGEVYM